MAEFSVPSVCSCRTCGNQDASKKVLPRVKLRDVSTFLESQETALMTEVRRKPVVLIVRDGWGKNPDPKWDDSNAILLAKKPIDDGLMAKYPSVLIARSG